MTRGSSSRSSQLVSPQEFLLFKERDDEEANSVIKAQNYRPVISITELQPLPPLPALTDISGQVMSVSAECGAEDWTRSNKEIAAKQPSTETAECLGLWFYCFHTLTFSRKYSTKIKEQAEILKALGFSCLCSLGRTREGKEVIMEWQDMKKLKTFFFWNNSQCQLLCTDDTIHCKLLTSLWTWFLSWSACISKNKNQSKASTQIFRILQQGNTLLRCVKGG